MITGKKIYLIPFTDRHLQDPAYLSWLRDEEVMRYIGREEYLTQQIPFEDVEAYIHSLRENKFCHFFAMHDRTTDAFVGTVKITFINESGFQDGIADVGIMIGNRDFWGKGLAKDALLTASVYAFDELGARKLSAGAMGPNVAVVKAFQSIGYRQEGCLREKVRILGRFYDHVLLGCFKNELKRDA